MTVQHRTLFFFAHLGRRLEAMSRGNGSRLRARFADAAWLSGRSGRDLAMTPAIVPTVARARGGGGSLVV